MSTGRRLAELLVADQPQLDRLMAVVASVDRAPPSEASIVTRFDDLASELASGTDVDDVVHHVFGTLGFRGNTGHYYDARNSLIHHVLERRLAIPLTLSVVAIEIGRRLGVTLTAVGLPGHVLLGIGEYGTWFDPFAGGRSLTRSDCEHIFHSMRPDAAFSDAHLDDMSTTTIIARTLENLRVACLRSGNLSQMASVLSLRASLPGAPLEFRIEYSGALASLGRYDAAADQRDLLAGLQPSRADHHALEAKKLRAHRN